MVKIINFYILRLKNSHSFHTRHLSCETPNALAGVKFSHPNVEIEYDPDTGISRIAAHTVDVIVTNRRTGERREIRKKRQGIINKESISTSEIPTDRPTIFQQMPLLPPPPPSQVQGIPPGPPEIPGGNVPPPEDGPNPGEHPKPPAEGPKPDEAPQAGQQPKPPDDRPKPDDKPEQPEDRPDKPERPEDRPDKPERPKPGEK